ncbi:MAG TPA: hypothetical protein VJH03_07285 [Blastocatellia bacterium]|nr:hypothetical protein [Blastocatellia bacterium]
MRLTDSPLCASLCALVLVLLVFHAGSHLGTVGSRARSIKQSNPPSNTTPTSQGVARRPGESTTANTQRAPQSKKAEKTSKPPKDVSIDKPNSQSEARKKEALALLEAVLSSAQKIRTDEYRILTEVEAATLLWQLDKERSIAILKRVVHTIRALLQDKNESTEVNPQRKSKERMLWFLVMRRIAALKPELVQQLVREGEPDPKPREAISGIWTEEARAMLIAASELIEKDPVLAARVAEQALPLGFASYSSFLRELARRDSVTAERFATVIIDRLRDSPINPIALRNFASFVSARERSATLRDHFFEALATRLRREILPDKTLEDLADALSVARGMAEEAGRYSAYWQQELEAISLSLEGLFNQRSLALPAPPTRRMIDMSAFSPAQPGDTRGIRDSLPQVGAIRDTKARDIEYQKLASKAATNDDLALAEEIMSKISDDGVRRETSIQVYSPLVRKSLGGSQWRQAQNLASQILDPLARALVFDRMAQEMAKAGEDTFSIVGAYDTALARLYRDDATDRKAKAFLIIARPLLKLDRERGIDAIKSCAKVMGQLSDSETPPQESAIGSAASTWILYPNPTLSADEVLNLPDLVTTTFVEAAERNVEDALTIASSINDRGMQSLAQLAICKVLLKEANRQTVGTKSTK